MIITTNNFGNFLRLRRFFKVNEYNKLDDTLHIEKVL